MSTEMMGSALQKQKLLYLSAYAKCGVPLPSFKQLETSSWKMRAVCETGTDDNCWLIGVECNRPIVFFIDVWKTMTSRIWGLEPFEPGLTFICGITRSCGLDSWSVVRSTEHAIKWMVEGFVSAASWTVSRKKKLDRLSIVLYTRIETGWRDLLRHVSDKNRNDIERISNLEWRLNFCLGQKILEGSHSCVSKNDRTTRQQKHKSEY